MLTKDQTAKLRAWVIARARAYVSGSASYDDTCFTTAEAETLLGTPPRCLLVYQAIEDLEREGLVKWHWPSRLPGYWMPTAAATRAEVAP